MKSILPVDETWTISSFKRLQQNAEEILELNRLPYAACPYASIATQLLEFGKYLANTIPETTYSETQHVSAVKANLMDSAKTYAIANLDAQEFQNYQHFGTMPGNLIIPANLVTEQSPIPNYVQQEIMQQTTVGPIREILRKIQTTLDIPFGVDTGEDAGNNWYWKPTGDVTIQIEGEPAMEIPCFPERVSDNISTSWSQEMTTYQHYEPENTFKQSGPRITNCLFKIHRAMWDGNQDSGKAEALIAYMQSACYPDYQKQAAEPPRVTLIIGKSIRTVGILTSMDTNYYGTIGPDDKYDCVDISISITEESDNILSTQAVRSGLAGWR